MSGLATKASTNEGATELFDVIHQNNLDSPQLADVSSTIESPGAANNLMNNGRSLLNSLFGGRTKGLTDWIASQAGINPASSGSLLSLALPLVLGQIGRRIGGRGVSGLKDLLGEPGTFLRNAPAGLAGILGLGGAAAGARRAVTDVDNKAAAYVDERRPAQSSPWKWLLPLILLLGLVGLLFYFFNRPAAPTVAVNPPAASTPAPAASTPTATPPAAPAGNLGAFIDKRLSNGVSLRIPTNGVENRLIGFIEDSSRNVDKETWFSFDRLEFETGSAALRPTSQEQLRNVAEILKAYPNVAVKLGGYTDNTGNAAQNLKLSQDRANTTMRELVALGIDNSRIAAEGYGNQFPVADNATEEGRQRNRRIDIRVTRK
jgi:outer membrane protein OmpA-like peptidoglycan-associated protein